MKTTNLVGQRFTRLLVLDVALSRRGHQFYRCLCDCGREVERRLDGLLKGETKSCGCLAQINARPAIDRVLEKTIISTVTGCWEFHGSRQEKGHGLIRTGSRTDGTSRLMKAHRVTYEFFIGSIPKGLVLDHVVCTNPPCVNPWHLEPVTRAENSRRAILARTHCIHGHEFAVVGYIQLDKERRMCRVCYRAILERQGRPVPKELL